MITKILNWFKGKNDLLPSKELKAFLKAKDLDDLLRLNSSIKELNENDNQIVRKILKDWKENQAISNLLFHPRIIPKDIRKESISRGLNEQNIIYFNLASIVGLQNLEKLSDSDEEENNIKNKLFEFIKETEDIRAMRATSTLQGKVSKNDISKIIECGTNKNDGVRTNLIALIAELFGKENIDFQLNKYKDKFEKETESLREELEQQRKKIEDAPEEKKAFFRLMLGRPLIGYIPNLK